jgi:hypothetical protein
MLRTSYLNWLSLPLWASPGNTIYDEILRSNGWRGERRSNSLIPAYSIYAPEFDAIEDPPPPPKRSIPTDVPVKEPHDVPPPKPRPIP